MKVLRAFKTPQRRFSVGVAVVPSDIDGPMSFDDWVAGGFVGSDEPKPVAVVAPEPEAASEPFFEDRHITE
jgi:hypothetical protein